MTLLINSSFNFKRWRYNINFNDFVTDVVGSLQYCSAVQLPLLLVPQENLSWYSVLKISRKVTHVIKC